MLKKRSNGTRSVVVTLPAGEPVRFRHLADGGLWFDDPQAHAHDQQGSLLQPVTPPPGPHPRARSAGAPPAL